MLKKLKYAIIILLIVVIAISLYLFFNKDNLEIKTIKSNKQLMAIYEGDSSESNNFFINTITMPFSFLIRSWDYYSYGAIEASVSSMSSSSNYYGYDDIASSNSSLSTSVNKTSSKDYSTTNIQVENVDEADITKTDGDYIYSISEDNVIITNVMNPNKIEIASVIKPLDSAIPEDLILYKDKLIVISETNNSTSRYYYTDNRDTIVKIYDITKREKPNLIKEYKLYEPYYTSRCIDNELYVISSGYLRKDGDKIVTYYSEDNKEKEIGLNNIKYLKDVKTRKQTLISVVDLNDAKSNVNVTSYLIDISNSYVSENSIYLLDQKYEYTNSYVPPIKSLFGLKGAIGPFEYDDYSYSNDDSGYYTEIYKFDILKEGKIKYSTKTKIKGKTINQYSLDEYNGHLRVALYDYNGARVAILDEKLNELGASKYLAKGETMYSSRFIGNKAYLVTYKVTDPLFVIDLSDEKQPKVLGELKIPGYSTYLHPYDENHLIGIGMETEETVNKNSSGKVTSTSSRIIGMKMALFDVSDVENPIQISSTVIGDSRTTSAILTNPKALLFSKERNLIAIPVNNYAEDFKVDDSGNSYTSAINSYTSYNKSYVAEGYFVYNIDIKNGFDLKGIVKHEKKNSSKNSMNYSYYNSRLLRGLYIDDNLYTVSEDAIKVNDLKNLNLISEMKIK